LHDALRTNPVLHHDMRKALIMGPSIELDDKVLRLIETYHTCEFLTVSKNGTPLAWPVAGAVDPDTGAFVVSTSIGFPQNAVNVRRDPRVALLFSDPTGSGADEPQQVLLQGRASCTDTVESGFVSHAFLWRRLLTIQPTSKRSAGLLTRTLMDAYFMRLFITIDPTRVTLLPAYSPPASTSVTPSTQLPSIEPLRKIVEELQKHSSAVLAAFDAEGRPILARTTATEQGGVLRLAGLGATSLREGRASLLAHSHDERLGGLSSFAASGELVRDIAGWYFSPKRFIPGQNGGFRASLRFLRTLRRTAAAYLTKRDLPRPVVPWNELAALNDDVIALRAHK
jgi:hypothetical protein